MEKRDLKVQGKKEEEEENKRRVERIIMPVRHGRKMLWQRGKGKGQGREDRE